MISVTRNMYKMYRISNNVMNYGLNKVNITGLLIILTLFNNPSNIFFNSSASIFIDFTQE